mmetsp:Transcript_28443/g.55701  ORF Transcript_28443/g.55701 Transcript_28443/m.55701 type:complete len:142 (-) Transcript_28443:1281-1706(-)
MCRSSSLLALPPTKGKERNAFTKPHASVGFVSVRLLLRVGEGADEKIDQKKRREKTSRGRCHDPSRPAGALSLPRSIRPFFSPSCLFHPLPAIHETHAHIHPTFSSLSLVVSLPSPPTNEAWTKSTSQSPDQSVNHASWRF